jgi:hypothetical protein
MLQLFGADDRKPANIGIFQRFLGLNVLGYMQIPLFEQGFF